MAALLQLARKSPHPDRWRVLCEGCEHLPEEAFHEIESELIAALTDWPLALRKAPQGWLERLEQKRALPAAFSLVRALHLKNLKSTSLKRVFKSPLMERIELLRLEGGALGPSAGVKSLISESACRSVRELELVDCDLGSVGFELL